MNKLKIVIITSIVIIISVVMFISMNKEPIDDLDNNLRSGLSKEKESSITRTLSTDTYDLGNGKYSQTIYFDVVNTLWKGRLIPSEDYLNPIVSENTLIVNDPDGNKLISFEMDYKKTSFFSLASPEINVVTQRGGYYFTTEVGTDIESMEYKLSSDYEFEFIDDELIIGNDTGVKIDFNMAKKEQNITTTFDKVNSKLIFEIEENKTGSLRMVDPSITLNDGNITASFVFIDDGWTFFAAQTKWKIDEIPSEKVIKDATYCMYVDSVDGPPDTDNKYWRINDQTWTESSSVATINSQTTTNETIGIWNQTPTLNEWLCTNITNVIQTDYDLENTYSSIRIEDADYAMSEIAIAWADDFILIGWSGGTEVYFRAHTKGASPAPYLIVNYVDSGPSDTCATCAVDCSDNCIVTTNIDCEGGAFTLTGTGIYTLNGGNVTNFNSKFIVGTDVSNKCIITRYGGAFISLA